MDKNQEFCKSAIVIKKAENKHLKVYKKKKILKYSTGIISAVISIVMLLLLVIVPISIREAMFTRKGYFDLIDPVVSKNAEINAGNPCFNDGLQNWVENQSKEIDIKSTQDGANLHAYKIDNENKTNEYALICHGFMRDGKFMAYYADRFYRLGYNILLPDARSHGKSDGDLVGMGWKERFDIVDWINHIVENDKDSKIFLFGVSMGAATVMSTVGEKLPSNVKMAIEDCGYSSLWDQYKLKFEMAHAPVFPVLNMLSVYYKNKLGYDMKEVSPENQVKKCKIPMMFIHGTNDKIVPYPMFKKVCNAMPENVPSKIFSAEGKGHVRSCTDPNYWSSIGDFLNLYMK